ncbi:MAG: mobile mystery protein B [Actinobacteria bacterium]|nr:MAG: mobile mystery protein B [Actinomycetota bacterium]
MRDPLVPGGDGHTALGEDDRQGLIPSYIATRGELFEAEQRNISEALLRRAPPTGELLDDGYLRGLHKAMFGDVWSWAGIYRNRDTNLGLSFEQISGAVRSLVLDTVTWFDSATYEPDEMSIRFHHRLVAIHPFPNGNGRHGRIAADYLVVSLGQSRFTWGAASGVSIAELRHSYLTALRAADGGDMRGLLHFARS